VTKNKEGDKVMSWRNQHALTVGVIAEYSRVQKAGLNGTGSQRMRCEACKHYFTPHQKPMGYSQELRQELRAQAIKMHLEGMSFRSVGRALGVNFQSVINWFRFNAAHDQLPQQVEDTNPTQTVEIDELFTFVGKKSDKRTS
jgi:transposase-like protein